MSDLQSSKCSQFIFTNPKMAWIWLIVRLYVGYEWLHAGYLKVISPAWVGENAGSALKGFNLGALQKMGGEHPDVQFWYGWFLQNIVIPNSTIFSYLVSFGEVLVGIALILGIFTGLSAFFGAFMNYNFLLAGAVSINPILFFLSILLIASWRIAGSIGLDTYLQKRFKTFCGPFECKRNKLCLKKQ